MGNWLVAGLVFQTFFAFAGDEESLPTWLVAGFSRSEITGVTNDGSGVCLKDGVPFFPASSKPSKEILVAALSGKGACRPVPNSYNSDLTLLRCEVEEKKCLQALEPALRSFNCDAKIDKPIRSIDEGKTSIIFPVRSSRCRILARNLEIPCSDGFSSRWLFEGQQTYKVCASNQVGTAGAAAGSPSGSSGVNTRTK